MTDLEWIERADAVWLPEARAEFGALVPQAMSALTHPDDLSALIVKLRETAEAGARLLMVEQVRAAKVHVLSEATP